MERNYQIMVGGDGRLPVAADITAEPDTQRVISRAMSAWKKQTESQAATFAVVHAQYLVAVKNSQGDVVDTVWVHINNKQ